jgi:UPF0176 protein
MLKVLALYQFKTIKDPVLLQQRMLAECLEQHIKGTLLIACEGINGTLAGSEAAIDYLWAWLRDKAGFEGLMVRVSWSQCPPFGKLKVKLKNEIVTMGVEDIDPQVCVGTYVEPSDWNALIQRPDVLLIDTRNDYEYQLGTFVGAINPHIEYFRQFPAYMQQLLQASPLATPRRFAAIAMFCTGGIRCEKASAYAKQLGIKQVFHLKGGILHYLETIPVEHSLWQGECFVFDERLTVQHGLVARYAQ